MILHYFSGTSLSLFGIYLDFFQKLFFVYFKGGWGREKGSRKKERERVSIFHSLLLSPNALNQQGLRPGPNQQPRTQSRSPIEVAVTNQPLSQYLLPLRVCIRKLAELGREARHSDMRCGFFSFKMIYF